MINSKIWCGIPGSLNLSLKHIIQSTRTFSLLFMMGSKKLETSDSYVGESDQEFYL